MLYVDDRGPDCFSYIVGDNILEEATPLIDPRLGIWVYNGYNVRSVRRPKNLKGDPSYQTFTVQNTGKTFYYRYWNEREKNVKLQKKGKSNANRKTN